MSRLFLALGLALFLSSFEAVYSADSGSCSASSSSCKCRDGEKNIRYLSGFLSCTYSNFSFFNLGRDGRDGKPGKRSF